MSTTLIDNDRETVTRFFGGTELGVMIQHFDKKTRKITTRPATEEEKAAPAHEPELEFTETEIREVFEQHTPSSVECDLCGYHLVCDCDFKTDWSVKHVMEALHRS